MNNSRVGPIPSSSAATTAVREAEAQALALDGATTAWTEPSAPEPPDSAVDGLAASSADAEGRGPRTPDAARSRAERPGEGQQSGAPDPTALPGAAANDAAPEEAEAKVVKRYSNRKLYDTARSRYVTLDDIAQMVKAGEDVRIIDNESKEDLTSVTLTQIIHEEEKTARRVPLGMLRSIIQSGGETLNEFFDRSVASVASAQKTVEESVTEFRRGTQTIKDVAAKQLADLGDTARRLLSGEARRAEEFRKATGTALDQLQSRLEERTEHVAATRRALAEQRAPEGEDVDEQLERSTHTREHVAALRERLRAVAQLVDALEASARAPEPEPPEE